MRRPVAVTKAPYATGGRAQLPAALCGQERSTGSRTPRGLAVQATKASCAATDRAQTVLAKAACAAGGAPIEVHRPAAQTNRSKVSPRGDASARTATTVAGHPCRVRRRCCQG
jgi:hypothetical protein